ncbi:MAG: hypothetical protein IJD75_03960 [Clostridia bacterium]|nr:hypothetical protein [Clostridia bacterium]MBQ3014275.1 hypothetical protein [Clostridia bacterium]
MKILKTLGAMLLHLLFSLLVLLLVAWIGLLVAKLVVYPDYMDNKETICSIPGIHEGYVPQGLDHVDDNTYLFSGYHGDNMLSLYLSENGVGKQILPIDKNGKALVGHGGGITSAKDFVYIASEGKLYIFSLSQLKSAESGDKVSPIGIFPVDTEASFCFANDTHLFVGEFYKAEDYEIDHSHAYTTPAGDEHRALISCYPLNEDGSITDEYPLYSISVTSWVQGFAVKGDTYMVSRSWGLNSSTLEFYEGLKDSGKTIDVSGKEVPLYYLDSSNHQKTVKMPAFSEDLDVVGNRVIVSFESACNKYIVGKLFFADKVISYPIED